MTDENNRQVEADGESAATEERALLARAQGLSTSLRPDPGLWQKIAVELSEATEAAERPTTTWLPKVAWAVAAGVVLSFGAALVLDQADNSPNAGTPLAQVDVPEPAGRDPLDASLMPVALPQMRSRVLAMLDSDFADVPAPVRETVLRNLQVISAARQEIEQALGVHPNDPLLRRLLLANYGNELNLLENIETITRQQQRRIQL